MLKIAVCEDEAVERILIKEHIEEYTAEYNIQYVIRLFDSAEQFLESGHIPDILFLDILMNEKDGLQLGRELRNSKNNIIIIYTTSLEEKMAAAFNKIHSFGFLVKPIGKVAIYKMLDDAIAEIEKRVVIPRVTFVSENNTLIDLSIRDIYYFEYSSRKIRIATKDGDYTCINEKITGIADKMEPYGFVMSHQSFVVNLYYVNNMRPQSLIMKNGDSVYLAQKRAAAVRKKLMQFVKETTENGGSKT